MEKRGGIGLMSLLREINDSIREKDIFEQALEEADAKGAQSCADYMNPSRAKDFAKEIANLMDDGMSYGDAKAKVFDEDAVPPAGSECCKFIRSMAVRIQRSRQPKAVKESARVATHGPFDSHAKAVSNAKSELGGGTEGYNFAVTKKTDGHYWSETDEEGNLPSKKSVKESATSLLQSIRSDVEDSLDRFGIEDESDIDSWATHFTLNDLGTETLKQIKALTPLERKKVEDKIDDIVSSVIKSASEQLDESVLTEARKKIGQKESEDGSRKAVIYRDAEWEEFQVDFYQDGKKQEKATYHTDDKGDANDTAEGFVKKRF